MSDLTFNLFLDLFHIFLGGFLVGFLSCYYSNPLREGKYRRAKVAFYPGLKKGVIAIFGFFPLPLGRRLGIHVKDKEENEIVLPYPLIFTLTCVFAVSVLYILLFLVLVFLVLVLVFFYFFVFLLFCFFTFLFFYFFVFLLFCFFTS